MIKTTVSEITPICGEIVGYEGMNAIVCYCPFDRSEENLGFLYTDPSADKLFWREAWPNDIYERKST